MRNQQSHNDSKGGVAWPPKVLYYTEMGVIRDSTHNWYPRDIGRSSELLPTHDRSNPNVSSYKVTKTQGNEIAPFIGKLDGDEDDWKIWSFGGIVMRTSEVGPDVWEGYTFFEVTKPIGPLKYQHQYTGIAEVFCNIVTGQTHTSRPKGSPSSLFRLQIHTLYLKGVMDICIARVNPSYAMRREYYVFWDGVQWSSDIGSSVPIMPNMQHGQIFPTKMFGSSSPYIWAFVGCTAFGDNKVMMGRATSPEGPWDIQMAMAFSQPKDGLFRYCVYPHPWADNTKETGDLTISWSEGGMTGGVLMSKIRFAMEGL
ncbi:unnamed protein product [Diplocarpon coronariae]